MPLAAIQPEDFVRPLALFGFAAQFMFFLRFAVQWVLSERRGRSYVPVAFWWLSCFGGVMLLVYASLKEDVVIMTGQAAGLMIYVRNLVLIYRRKNRFRQRRRTGGKPELREAAAES